MKKILTLIFAALTFTVAASSQIKLGHINSAELMRLMPELEEAELELQAHNRELEEMSRTMITEYENLVNEFQANQQQWSELIRNTRVRAIQDLETRIQEFRQSSERTFEQKREDLFSPIIEKARAAIEEVAKEHKYTYIFDTSGGTLLYSAESDNVMELVKKKMDLK
ncbi:MAG: OmpH family outer membrane protein [Bacteroidales bacterium]|nr:OmpH family outer membrane protein [Bacteroidales bacterium]